MLVNKTKWWLFIPNIINIGWDCWKCLLVSQCFACWCCSANDSKLPAARPWQAHVPVLTTYTSAWNANDGNGVLDWLVWSLDWTASCCWQRQLVCHLLSWVMWRCIVICVCVWYIHSLFHCQRSVTVHSSHCFINMEQFASIHHDWYLTDHLLYTAHLLQIELWQQYSMLTSQQFDDYWPWGSIWRLIF